MDQTKSCKYEILPSSFILYLRLNVLEQSWRMVGSTLNILRLVLNHPLPNLFFMETPSMLHLFNLLLYQNPKEKVREYIQDMRGN